MTDPKVVLVTSGSEKPLIHLWSSESTEPEQLTLKNMRSFRHGDSDDIWIANIAPKPGASIEIAGKKITLDARDQLVDLALIERGWVEGSVASDPVPLTPNDPSVWQIPVAGWSAWILLAAGVVVLRRRLT